MSRWVARAALVLGLAEGPRAHAGEPENVSKAREARSQRERALRAWGPSLLVGVTGAATEEVKATVDDNPLALGMKEVVLDEEGAPAASASAAPGPLPASEAKTVKPLPSATTKKTRDLGY
ncbi:hypothetical protein [Polyangium mundeleinium]|uniref:Uncharacterized protein n=1 Tax=Polyangium mundeleinium TaxID=2995306 RepID=A0ABT5F4L6_9BACT|nr:hypothetical protein [Polyangium mundeleinium]MDC0749030.1 hypothetical protein [Polyangium mundeleinium]